MDVLSEEAELLQIAFPGASREVITNVVSFCLEPHPLASLVKPLSVERVSHQWPDGKTTYFLLIEGAIFRAVMLLDDQGRPRTEPVSGTGFVVHDWWPCSFRCRRDSYGNELFSDYWNYAPGDERRLIPGAELTL
jgi:hypothetical protein